MTSVSLADLREHSDGLLDRVEAGESLVVTRNGKPVAELRPLGRATSAAMLVERWKHLPPIDPEELRAELDAIIDPSL
jgi:prevent-host-death family protein